MVDLKTAMAAAQAERSKRDGAKNAERKKRRSGADLGIEPFDPMKYVGKERADTASMWLVIVFAVVVTLLMRYVLMPSTTLDKTDVLYILPLTMLILIPQMHRIVMPERFKEHYTKGTWFRACFLYTFTFLSLSFLVVNPPFGDIVAPQLADEWGVVIEHQGNFTFADEVNGAENEWTLEQGEYIVGGAWVLFGLADNVDHTGAEVTVVHQFQNSENVIESDPTFWEEHGAEVNAWRTAENKSAPVLLPHADLDQPFAIFLGDNLAVGEHTILVEIVEQGDPWENTRIYTWTFSVNPPELSAE
ncbi:MAG TPA: hypothetical protein D7I13_00185 [Candidatus Poseidoniales archaeon]|nr:MAG TPA: hypothetical protein D7I13_00185 [Candidatus Poseidoniales archaeon]